MRCLIDDYIKKGFSPEYAAYFSAGRRTVRNVQANDDFTLTVTFDNGERRIYDMKPNLIPGTVFEPFTRLSDFKRVYIDEQHSISRDIDPTVDSYVYWNNKVDISSDCCYVEGKPLT